MQNSGVQTSPAASTVDRRVEVLVRSQFNVPPDYDISFGGKTKSDIPDFDNLPVTFTHSGKQTTVNFLLSKDGNTLARLEKPDAFASWVAGILVRQAYKVIRRRKLLGRLGLRRARRIEWIARSFVHEILSFLLLFKDLAHRLFSEIPYFFRKNVSSHLSGKNRFPNFTRVAIGVTP